jgi:hypothetical protein
MPTSSFKNFPELPAELRFQIWEAALSAPTVWATVPVTGGSNPNDATYTMTFVGPAPYMAGLACKEAWGLMKRLYGGPVRGPAGAPHITRPSWVDLDGTVVHLGDAADVMVLRAFDAETLSRVKHVALTWCSSQYYLIGSACFRLAEACPHLRTLIIQTWEEAARGGEDGSPGGQPQSPPGLETAAFYASLPAYTGRPLHYKGIRMAGFLEMLKYDLPTPPPTVHVLGPVGLPAIPS